jgi:hypothetical protein
MDRRSTPLHPSLTHLRIVPAPRDQAARPQPAAREGGSRQVAVVAATEPGSLSGEGSASVVPHLQHEEQLAGAIPGAVTEAVTEAAALAALPPADDGAASPADSKTIAGG